MKAYLFGWNPLKFAWADLDRDIAQLKRKGSLTDDWSVASHKSIKPGDRAYIVRVGVEPKGIFASGFIKSEPYMALRNRRHYHRIQIELDVLLNPNQERILSLDILKKGNLAEQLWMPQASGISIRPQLADELESVWMNLLSEHPHFGELS